MRLVTCKVASGLHGVAALHLVLPKGVQLDLSTDGRSGFFSQMLLRHENIYVIFVPITDALLIYTNTKFTAFSKQ